MTGRATGRRYAATADTVSLPGAGSHDLIERNPGGGG